MSTWFKEFPCPLHPSWGLDDISELDLRQLKQKIDADNNETMVVETKLYRAFLEYPCGRFYNQGRANRTEALRYLESAKIHLNTKFQGNVEAEVGYGIIIHTFHLWIRPDNAPELLLRDLIAKKDDHPDHVAYVDIVHAYFLSRLGPSWRDTALLLYESALERFPNNCEWLFGKALMLGREARQMGVIKGWEHQNVRGILEKEKCVLEHILHLDPNFNLARAFYGQVLFSLNDSRAGSEISQALQREPQNNSIAMVAARYFRRQNKFAWAETILKRLVETAETNHQLGLVYVRRARESSHSSERFSMWKTALYYFNKGVELNACHFPCFTIRAEMFALLGETEKAHELFREMFDHIYADSPHLYQNEILTIETALELRLVPRHLQVFSTEEIAELSHRYITLATMQDEFDDKYRKVEKRLETLKEISCNLVHKVSVRRLATLKLADAYRRLEHFEEAEKFYKNLYVKDNLLSYEFEIIWGLGKCYFRQGFSDKAITMASKLDRKNQNVSASELYADVYLERAKIELESETTFCANNMPLSNLVLQNLEVAIEMRSLEASYLFLSSITTLQNDFFSLELRIPQTLAKIKVVCEDVGKQNVHTHFKLKLDDGSEVIHDETMKRFAIEKKINKLLLYDTFNDTKNPRNVLLNELKELRESRLNFELELIKRQSNENWNTSCATSLRSTIQILRELLDHAITFYKESVLKDTSENCSFPVKFQDELGNVNKTRAKKMINDWVAETFIDKLPDETFRSILEVQPMYDKENIWLAALNELNNKLKHKNKVLYALEYFDLTLKKQRKITRKMEASKMALPHPSLRLKTEDIVRKSCKEVERLVLYFLSKRADSAVCKKVAKREDNDGFSLENMFSESF